MEDKLIQIGGIAALFYCFIREFFVYLKSKNNGGINGNGAILKELQTMNSNHLHSIQTTIEEGNNRLVDTIHQDNTRMIEILGEIKGRLK